MVIAINVDSVQLMGKNVRIVAKRTISRKNVVLEAKARDNLVSDHLNTGRSVQTMNPVMKAK